MLIALTQTNKVEHYIEQFEQYAGLLKGIEQNDLTEIVLNGLRKKLRWR